MKVTIYRGTHEIGGSCVEVEENSARIVIDLGLPLQSNGTSSADADVKKDPDKHQMLPKVDGLYQADPNSPSIDGLLISHAHMDHYGFLEYVHTDVPCYAGAAAWKLMQLSGLFMPVRIPSLEFHPITHGNSFNIGDLRITPYLMDHSAFDAYAFLVEGGGKSLLYTGDFRGHGRKPGALKRLLDEVPRNIDILMIEGTNLGKGELPFTEQQLEEQMILQLRETDGPVYLQCSAQNIDRMVTTYRAALQSQRILVVDLYTACVLDTVKDFAAIPYPGGGYRNIRVFYPKRLAQRLANSGNKELLHKFRSQWMSRPDLVKIADQIIMTVRPSMIDDLNELDLPQQGTLIYSMWEGYWQSPGQDIVKDFVNQHHLTMINLHTSGHAPESVLQNLIENLQPRKVVPIHTNDPAKYARITDRLEIWEDGVSVVI